MTSGTDGSPVDARPDSRGWGPGFRRGSLVERPGPSQHPREPAGGPDCQRVEVSPPVTAMISPMV